MGSKIFCQVLERTQGAVVGQPRPSLRDSLAVKYSKSGAPLPEKSEIVYVACWHLKASNKTEFAEALERLKVSLQVGSRLDKLVLTGDQQVRGS